MVKQLYCGCNGLHAASALENQSWPDGLLSHAHRRQCLYRYCVAMLLFSESLVIDFQNRPQLSRLGHSDKLARLHWRQFRAFPFLHHQRQLQDLTQHGRASKYGSPRGQHCRR